jgi:2-hydroxychromene-2-carboxylate isomerase
MKRNPSKVEQLELENNELIAALEDIAGLADEADDAALERSEIVEKLRAISERVEDEIDLDEEEEAPSAGE